MQRMKGVFWGNRNNRAACFGLIFYSFLPFTFYFQIRVCFGLILSFSFFIHFFLSFPLPISLYFQNCKINWNVLDYYFIYFSYFFFIYLCFLVLSLFIFSFICLYFSLSSEQHFLSFSFFLILSSFFSFYLFFLPSSIMFRVLRIAE